jgi:hypothetical protein
LAGARVIKPGQRVHASVAFIHNYKPKATLKKSKAEIEWSDIIGKGQNYKVDWADGLGLLEMDLFDYSRATAIIEQAKSNIHNPVFTDPLQFMASFCMLALSY